MAESPLYQRSEVRFRDAIDSSKFNDHTEQVLYDLTDLFNQVNDQAARTQEIREFFEVGSYFAQEQMDQMAAQIQTLQDDLAAVQAPGNTYTKTLYVTAMQVDASVASYEQANIDTQHGIVTLPTSGRSTSKLYLYDTVNSEYIVPNTLAYDIQPAADGVNISENDFMNAITPDEFLFWHRKYSYQQGLVDTVDCTITLTLPDNIISSRDVNTIYIHPFPLKAMDITDISYRLDGAWTTVPGFKPVQKAGNVKFCFPPIGISQIKVTLRQSNKIQKGNQDVFHMGIREIGVFYSDYQSGIGRFNIPVTFNNAFSNKQLIGINPIYMNEEALSANQASSRLLTFKVYEVDSTGKQTYLNDTFPIQVKQSQILLKGIMTLDQNTRSTPTLIGVQLLYKGDS